MHSNRNQQALIDDADYRKTWSIVPGLFQKVSLNKVKVLAFGYVRENYDVKELGQFVKTLISCYVSLAEYGQKKTTLGTVDCQPAYKRFHASWKTILSKTPINDPLRRNTIWCHTVSYSPRRFLKIAKQIRTFINRPNQDKYSQFNGFHYDFENDLSYFGDKTINCGVWTHICDITIEIDVTITIPTATEFTG